MTQGIQGTIRKLTGNHMPGPGAKNDGVQLLSVPVHVFVGRVVVHKKPVAEHPQRVAVIESDEKGQYRIELEPGEYTVVAEINGRMYLNLLAGDAANTWATVKVESGKWTTFAIDDTSDAVF